MCLSQIDNVIRTVLRNLAGKSTDKLSSKALKSRIIFKARHVADFQVATAVLEKANTSKLVGNCLQQNFTSTIGASKSPPQKAIPRV